MLNPAVRFGFETLCDWRTAAMWQGTERVRISRARGMFLLFQRPITLLCWAVPLHCRLVKSYLSYRVTLFHEWLSWNGMIIWRTTSEITISWLFQVLFGTFGDFVWPACFEIFLFRREVLRSLNCHLWRMHSLPNWVKRNSTAPRGTQHSNESSLAGFPQRLSNSHPELGTGSSRPFSKLAQKQRQWEKEKGWQKICFLDSNLSPL